MDIERTKTDDAFSGLDGSTVHVDVSLCKVPTKNEYFVGIIPAAMGIASILYAILHYTSFETGIKLSTEAWIFLVLGVLTFAGGIIMTLKAIKYLISFKPFFASAKFTKCNIRCFVEFHEYKDSETRERHLRKLYVLKVSYINDEGQHCTKIIKWLLADKYYAILCLKFTWSPEFLSLDNECFIAYNSKGKAVLVCKG